MRIAGSILGIKPDMIDVASDYLASEDTSNWPSINYPKPTPTETPVQYDPDMNLFAPQIPVETADAGKFLREYGNAILSPILGPNASPFGRTDLFGGKSMINSAVDSVNKINQRHTDIDDAVKQLLRK